MAVTVVGTLRARVVRMAGCGFMAIWSVSKPALSVMSCPPWSGATLDEPLKDRRARRTPRRGARDGCIGERATPDCRHAHAVEVRPRFTLFLSRLWPVRASRRVDEHVYRHQKRSESTSGVLRSGQPREGLLRTVLCQSCAARLQRIGKDWRWHEVPGRGSAAPVSAARAKTLQSVTRENSNGRRPCSRGTAIALFDVIGARVATPRCCGPSANVNLH
jgi:hypothetical protein